MAVSLLTQPLPATLRLPTTPIGELVAWATAVKNYQKWQAVQLAIHSKPIETVKWESLAGGKFGELTDQSMAYLL